VDNYYILFLTLFCLLLVKFRLLLLRLYGLSQKGCMFCKYWTHFDLTLPDGGVSICMVKYY
jgi:hypothetical protein